MTASSFQLFSQPRSQGPLSSSLEIGRERTLGTALLFSVTGWSAFLALSGIRDNRPPIYLEEPTFHYNFWKILLAVYTILPGLSRGSRQLGWTSCLVSAGRVTLAGWTTFSKHLGSPTRDNSRRVSRNFEISGFKAQIYVTTEKQNKLNKAHTDRMNERNSNEERFLEVWILNSFMNI